jgi:hypothetical protein
VHQIRTELLAADTTSHMDADGIHITIRCRRIQYSKYIYVETSFQSIKHMTILKCR